MYVQTMEEKQSNPPKGNTLGLVMFFSLLAVTVGLAIWMVLSQIWPASLLIKLQAGWFDGKYYPKYTIAVMWIFILLAFVVVISLADGLIKKIRGK